MARLHLVGRPGLLRERRREGARGPLPDGQRAATAPRFTAWLQSSSRKTGSRVCGPEVTAKALDRTQVRAGGSGPESWEGGGTGRAGLAQHRVSSTSRPGPRGCGTWGRLLTEGAARLARCAGCVLLKVTANFRTLGASRVAPHACPRESRVGASSQGGFPLLSDPEQ